MIGHRVERSVDFDVAIGGDRSTAHAEETEAGIRKRSEMLLFFDKAGPDLLLGGAVDALAGDSLVPTLQMLILRIQALEAASFERAGVGISDASFDFSVLVRSARMDGQHGEAVVASERTEDGIDLGVHQASPGDPGLEVIEANHLHAASDEDGGNDPIRSESGLLCRSRSAGPDRGEFPPEQTREDSPP